MNTPERGLLVYHGLGSGKTATSIAVIEANRTKQKIIVMVPASLQDNYELEIRKTWTCTIWKRNSVFACVRMVFS